MKKLVLTLIGICTMTGFARADLLYTFDLTAADASGIQPFTFSFTVPAFVTGGESPAFSPFVITDGISSVTMTQDVVGGAGCFGFATAVNGTVTAGCGGSAGPGTGASLSVETRGVSGLPITTGTINVGANGLFVDPLSPLGAFYAFTGTLSITTVAAAAPEPASITLFSVALATLGWKLRRARRLAPPTA